KQTMVIETEKERSNRRRMLAVAEASDDTVGGSDPFPLYRPVTRAGAIGQVEPLGDYSVQVSSDVFAPGQRRGEIAGGGRQGHPRHAECAGEDLQTRASFAQRSVDQRATPLDQEVEQDVGGGVLLGELLDAARGRMQTELQLVEGEAARDRYGQLAVEHEAP